jgi:streptomycin 3"-adenylyltransferase
VGRSVLARKGEAVGPGDATKEDPLAVPANATARLDPPTARQLEAVVALVREVLGADVLGAWLAGSAVAGELRASSDLDVFVVNRRATTDSERRRLVDGLLVLSGRRAIAGPSRSIELTIAAQEDVRPWRYPPPMDFQYGDWWRAELERSDAWPWASPNPDLAILITSVLRESEPLLGPPAADLLDPVPAADLAHAMRDGIPGLLDDLDSDTRNVLLTLARIWFTLETGAIAPKDEAASWVMARLPERHRLVLARARAIYLGEAPETFAGLETAVGEAAGAIVAAVARIP